MDASTNMAPRFGRGPRGQRVLGVAPFGHWKTTTFLAGLRHDRITAVCVFDGPINGQRLPRLGRTGTGAGLEHHHLWRQARHLLHKLPS